MSEFEELRLELLAMRGEPEGAIDSSWRTQSDHANGFVWVSGELAIVRYRWPDRRVVWLLDGVNVEHEAPSMREAMRLAAAAERDHEPT